MTDRPILFSAQMVRALLVGRKTQTRRVLPKSHPKFPQHNQIRMDVLTFSPHQPEAWYWDGVHDRVGASYLLRYAIGDRLWVREAHALVPSSAYRMSEGVVQVIDPSDRYYACVYREGWDRSAPHWRPSIHMPRWASRLTLIVADVRVQRLQDISEADAVGEGCRCDSDGWCDYQMPATQSCETARNSFRTLWNSLHGHEAWNANPWVAAISFRTIHANIDSTEAAA